MGIVKKESRDAQSILQVDSEPEGPSIRKEGLGTQNSGATGPQLCPDVPNRPTQLSFAEFAAKRTDIARDAFIKGTFPDVKSADCFFLQHGIGNDPTQPSLPFERHYYYELLLKKLQAADSNKYSQIHKGTPFYFLGWTAFDFGDYERAVFYMDAALAEDTKNVANWEEAPAAHFITLKDSGNQAAAVITRKLRQTIINEFSRFSCIPGYAAIEISGFQSKFIQPILRQPQARSILTAFYSFIGEYYDRLQMLKLRGQTPGSIEPFLVHLFKGGLIVESILKQLYVLRHPTDSLGKIFSYPEFMADFAITGSLSTTSTDIRTIIYDAKRGETARIAFETIGKVRNTSGHNLAWPDPFDDPTNYELLYRQTLNSILFVISKKYIDP